MTAIAPVDPLLALDSLDRFFEAVSRQWMPVVRGDGGGRFPVDLRETDDAFVVTAALPGVRPDDVNVSITGRVLAIRGEAQDEREERGRNYYRHERHVGAYCRVLELPLPVDAGKAEASLEHGVLTVRLPKAHGVRSTTISLRPKRTRLIERLRRWLHRN